MFGQTRALCAEYVFIYFVYIETNSCWKRKKKLLFVVVLTEN